MSDLKFRTVFVPEKFDFDISYDSKMLFAGSCFTENIGRKLEELKFDVLVNPFGIVYNPVSLSESLGMICDKKKFTAEDLFFYNGYWHSFSHHGSFSGPDRQKTLDLINSELKKAHDFLKDADLLFLTFGSAWVYYSVDSKNIVANCHKLPGNNFIKELLAVKDIEISLNKTLEKIKKINKSIKIIFTVSPVRHLKDGFSENFLSKSILRVAINNIMNNNGNIFYFPAYELINDDLRDYRFYDKDMVHPSSVAEEYIFNFFEKSFFSEETRLIKKEAEKIISARNHRVFDSENILTLKFADAALKKIKDITQKYPFLNFDEEVIYFKSFK
ncbi:MAG: GSCFA domain-containing protein [Chlorobi bacterium]|nr:GSCFA domain-containing protein [Chlorobiota bacterium]